MSIIEELKRRNVFKVGTAYVVAAWLIIQFSDILLDNMDAPSWVLNAIMLVLAIGFVITLFVAWAFEVTPEGIKREADVDRSQSITPQTGKKLNMALAALLAVAVGYILYDKISGPAPGSSTAAETVQATVTQDPAPVSETEPEISPQSIAVLPFDNRSPDPNDAYFTDGIHDDLLTNLSRVGALKVISRTSVTQYKGTEKTIPVIAQELGVAHIMEGAVQRAGNQVRINVQLIDAQTDEHLWAEIFDRELTAENLFVIQSEISQAIADALEATLTDDEQQQLNRVPTENLLAYEAFLKGKQLQGTREANALEQAEAEFRRAVELDPEFALAWVGLADTIMLQTAYGSTSFQQGYGQAKEHAEKALEIDDRLGEAYASLSQVYWFEQEQELAEQAHKTAIELSPNYATNYHWYSNSLKQLPLRIDDSINFALKAVELDPNSAVIRSNLASAYGNKGLYSMAERAYLEVHDLHPQFAQSYASLASVYASGMGRLSDAIGLLQQGIERAPNNMFQYSQLSDIYLELGYMDAATALRDRMAQMDDQHLILGYQDIQINLYRGNNAAARESIAWTLPKAAGVDFALHLFAQNQMMLGDLNGARETYLSATPNWLVESEHDGLVSRYPTDACTVSWLLMHTGDENLGRPLLAKASKFLLDDLPAVNEHADEFYPQICHAAAGDFDAALMAIETNLNHNHLLNWKIYHLLPMFDPIRDDPRFIALEQQYQGKIAEQRALYERSQETGP